MSDPIKDLLQEIKDDCCGTGDPPTGGIKQVVGTTTGELSQQQKDDAEALLRTSANDGAQDHVESILDEANPPSFDPPSLGGGFTPYDATGKDTDDIIADCCQQACDALDDYCEENFTPAAKMTRRLETTIIAFRESAGIDE